MRSTLLAALGFTLVGTSHLSAAESSIPKDQLDFFENKVRPVLADKCYKCHSIEKGKSKGGLTLDTRDGWMEGGEGGAVIIPGEPDQSRLIQAIRYADEELQMPPKGEKLKDEEIESLVQWVKIGAPDPRVNKKSAVDKKLTGLTETARSHWAYQPLKRFTPPRETSNANWCATPVDHFILAELDKHSLKPAPSATKEALIRRAYYDLTGLPPTPREVQDFVTDTSPQAFEKVVDRLLASPHYGERWGRHWLDTARYSDTTGGEKNAVTEVDYRYPYAWTYRDYVIDAFNKDKPYNEFIVEQIAADLLPETKQDPTKLAALGFLTVGQRFRNVHDVINDRIDVVSKAFVAQTVSCARCHDHMFDPIPTADYYSWHGVFASTTEPLEKPLIKPGEPEHAEDFNRKLAGLEARNRQVYYNFIDRTLSEFHGKAESYLTFIREGNRKRKRNSAEELKKQAEIAQRDKLDMQLAGFLAKGGRRDPIVEPLRGLASLEETGFAAASSEFLKKLKSQKRRPVRPNNLVLDALMEQPLNSMEDVIRVYAGLFQKYSSQKKAYIDACAAATTGPVQGFEQDVVDLIQWPFKIMPASEANTVKLHSFMPQLGNQLARRVPWIFHEINELELTHPGAPARAMLVEDAPKPRNSPIFIRGQAQVRGDQVPRHTLSIFSKNGKPEPFKQGSGRLELARSLASPENALTSRVAVNRIWMHHFGEGIVPTPDYFGTQAEAPSHPELLDYLAGYFVENGWSIKKLHRLIMLSSTYQQSTQTNAEYEKIDPRNRLLWRANLRRLDFESLRDTLLVFTGKLDTRIGGQPVNLVEEPYSFRRSVYGYIDRGNLPDLMSQFDFPDPNMPNSKRSSTIVPQQALFLMNSSMALDAVQTIAERPEVAQAKDDNDKLFQLYRIVFQRTPRPEEVNLAMQFVSLERQKQPEVLAMADQLNPDARRKNQNRRGGNRKKADAAKVARVNGTTDNSTTMSPANTTQMTDDSADPMMSMTDSMAPASPQDKKRQQQKKGGGYRESFRPIQNTGEAVTLRPLTPWESYIQALLFSNEASYVN
jgi:hypothetical protein